MTELEKAIMARDAAVKMLAKMLKRKSSEIIKDLEENKAEDVEAAFDDAIDDIENSALEDGRKAVRGELFKLLKKNGFEKKIEKLDDVFITNLKEAFKGESSATENENEEITTLKNKIKSLEKSLADKDIELEDKLAEINKAHKQEIVKMGMLGHIKSLIKDLGAKQPDNEEKATAKLNKMIKAEGINEGLWAWDEKRKDYISIDEEGNAIREGGQVKTLKSILSANLEYHYDIIPAEAKDSGGLPDNKTEGGSSNIMESRAFEWKHYKGTAPKTREDVDRIIDDPTQPLDIQNEVYRYWETVGSRLQEQK